MRTFIAIDLSQEIKSQLTATVRLLKPVARDIKWVAPDNYHLTLKFIGEVAEEQVEVIKAVLNGVASKHNRFNLAARGTGSFPPGQSRMRVIWVGLEAGPELYSIQSDLEEALSREGFQREERSFAPHLTIGRPENLRNMETAEADLRGSASRCSGPWR